MWTLAEAREALQRLVGVSSEWAPLDQYLISYLVEPKMIPTVLASSLAAMLELVREGHLEMNQQQAFAPIFLRKHSGDAGFEPTGGGAPAVTQQQ